mmetsp:Transcript_44315/g.50172  ORF Transcript_44315/g.50172 Transcript_44315/m.50172 type:complete len:150 (+) Transcript_44315:485-934(+)
MGRTLIAMNHWMRGAGSGSGVNIHHCITEGTKDSVALIFSINGDLISDRDRTLRGKRILRAGWKRILELEQGLLHYTSLSIYKGSRAGTIRITLPANIIRKKSEDSKYEKYLQLKLEVELASPLLRAILNIKGNGNCCIMRAQYYLPNT